MNKKYMVLFAPDVTAEASSASDKTQQAQQTADVNTNKGQQQSAAATPSLADVIKNIQAKHDEKQAALDGDKAVDSDSSTEDTLDTSDNGEKAGQEAGAVPNENSTEADASAEGDEGNDQAESDNNKAQKQQELPDATKVDDSKLPFGKHPRFQELVREKNEVKTKLAELTPIAERMRMIEEYCVKNNIDATSYDQALRLAGMIRTNPEGALQQLEEVVASLRVTTGAALPADLQTQVDNDVMTEASAQALAKERISRARAEYQLQQTQQQQMQRFQQEVKSSLDSWTAQKSKTDLAFKPKANASANDGKFELVQSQFAALWTAQPPSSIAEAVNLAERAYANVDRYVASLIPRPVVTRPLTPNRNAPANRNMKIDTSKPGWAKKVAQNVLATRMS